MVSSGMTGMTPEGNHFPSPRCWTLSQLLQPKARCHKKAPVPWLGWLGIISQCLCGGLSGSFFLDHRASHFCWKKKFFGPKKEKVLWRWQCSMTFFMIEYDTFSGIRTWWDLVESFYGNIWNILEYYGLDFNSQNGKNVCFQTGLPFLIHFWDVSRALKVATRDWDSTCPSWHHVDLICLKNGDLRWSEPMSASESAEIRPETLKLGVAKNLKGYIVYCHVWLAEGM